MKEFQLKNKTLSVKDYFKSGEEFSLIWNEKWNCFETHPKPSESEIGKYYESENYISHQKKPSSLKDIVYNLVRNYMLKKKMGWLKNVSKGNKLLDVGCGIGEFIKIASKFNFEVTGIEPNAKARKFANKNKLEVVESLSSLKNKKFDIVTLWHVLEHLHHPDAFLHEIKNFLNEEGMVCIAVPNFNSYDAKYYKNYWAAYDVPRHLFHFSKASIHKLAEENNFKIIKTYPLKFDSYYVAMLSEKYKSKKLNLNWLWQGFISNKKAKRNGEWSSLVFMLQMKK